MQLKIASIENIYAWKPAFLVEFAALKFFRMWTRFASGIGAGAGRRFGYLPFQGEEGVSY